MLAAYGSNTVSRMRRAGELWRVADDDLKASFSHIAHSTARPDIRGLSDADKAAFIKKQKAKIQAIVSKLFYSFGLCCSLGTDSTI
jgi:hypothetical protein